MEKTDGLIIIAEEKHLKDVGKTLHENGFKLWTDRPFDGLSLMHITGAPEKIQRLGCTLIGLSHSFPSTRMELADKKGFV